MARQKSTLWRALKAKVGQGTVWELRKNELKSQNGDYLSVRAVGTLTKIKNLNKIQQNAR